VGPAPPARRPGARVTAYHRRVARDPRFDALAQSADPAVTRAIAELVEHGADGDLHRINVIDFAAARDLSLVRVVDAFVHASKLGLFDMSWNLLCPGCGGLLDASAGARGMRASYDCNLCATAYAPTLDDMVEVSFTVSPAVRRIRAHDPDSLSPFEFYREMFFNQGLVVPGGDLWDTFMKDVAIEAEAIGPLEKVVLSTTLPAEFIIVFDPVTHACTFIDVKGEPVRERRDVTIPFQLGTTTATRLELAPGPVRLVLHNTTDRRIVPGVFSADEKFHDLFHHKRSFFTAKHLLSNQTFRDVYRTDTLAVDQKLAISNLTILFTDLKSSTELYERVGDLVAYDLVQRHFRVLADVVRTCGGAVVKTIGDAIMATFPTPERGLDAALGMRDAMTRFNGETKHDDLLIKIGIHAGPCLAVMLNERLDYFGSTVNIAARVQGLADAQGVLTTDPVVAHGAVQAMLAARGLSAAPQRAQLKGIADEVTVYEVR
jgi:class 3 adenylate cyclase